MIEVFKTNVASKDQAVRILDRIHRKFDQYRANFDLQDCDRILRIVAPGAIPCGELIELMLRMGVVAETLQDEVPTIKEALENREYVV